MKNKANIFLFTACLFTFGLIAYNMLTYEKNQIEFKEIEEVITIDWEEREQAIDPKDFVSAYDEDAVYLASNFEIMLVNVEQPLVISAISQEDRHTFAKKEYRLLIKDEKDPVIEYHGPKVIKYADMNDFRLEDYLEVYDIGDTTAEKYPLTCKDSLTESVYNLSDDKQMYITDAGYMYRCDGNSTCDFDEGIHHVKIIADDGHGRTSEKDLVLEVEWY